MDAMTKQVLDAIDERAAQHPSRCRCAVCWLFWRRNARMTHAQRCGPFTPQEIAAHQMPANWDTDAVFDRIEASFVRHIHDLPEDVPGTQSGSDVPYAGWCRCPVCLCHWWIFAHWPCGPFLPGELFITEPAFTTEMETYRVETPVPLYPWLWRPLWRIDDLQEPEAAFDAEGRTGLLLLRKISGENLQPG